MGYAAEVKERFYTLRAEGNTIERCATILGVSRNTLSTWENTPRSSGETYRQTRLRDKLPRPQRVSQLTPAAKRALKDFGYFRHRYLGRRSTPWQEEAAVNVVEWLTSPETELIVINCPPGSGKTTLFTLDIPLWMICRNRSIRIFLGHRSKPKAQRYAEAIRRMLDRTHPLPADPSKGREFDAEGCLALDYGRFRPFVGENEIWRSDEFTVLTEYDGNESNLSDKDPTVAAEGMGSEFLGARSELVIWDDLVTNSILRSADQVDAQRVWWDNEGVTRVEPGGALILLGQRMGANDLYRYCLDEKLVDEDGVDTSESRYRHIIYPAHFETTCTGNHRRTKEELAYPNGCLLDPWRIPWTGRNGLATIQHNRSEKYRVQYQQEDTDPTLSLINLMWINGGTDPNTSENYPGCLDHTRNLCDIPYGLSAPWYSIATADPSPTNWWAVEWWIYHPASNQRFLIDLHRSKMEAPDFLDWNHNNSTFFGLAQDWQERSHTLHAPITHWIIENNAAQRFLLQYDHTKRWQRKWGVAIIPHSTTRNKLDPEYGLQMLANLYRYGNVRLPYKAFAVTASQHLIREGTNYATDGSSMTTDDCLMAQWFFEYHIPNLARPDTPRRRLPRPSFMRELTRV